MGRIDGVVDIVGMARYAALADVDDDNWNWHFDIVLRHAFLAMQHGAAAMKDTGGGAMVFVASVSGITVGADARGVRRGQGRADGAGEARPRSSTAGTTFG